MSGKNTHYNKYIFDDFISDDSFLNYANNKNQFDVLKWEKWLSDNPKNKKIALEAKNLISQLRLKDQSLSNDFVNDEWSKLHGRLKLKKIKGESKSRSVFRMKIWKYAAVASIFLFFLASINYYIQLDSTERVITYLEVIVPKGEIKKIILPDSSIVFLNSDSKLKYNNFFGEEYRDVFLEGEANFEVTHNDKIPFIVHTSQNKVTVLGTIFNVYAFPTENIFRASLERGKISVSHNNKDVVELRENQTYLLHKDLNKSEIIESKTIQFNSLWKSGIIVFNNEPITKILHKLERSHNVNFKLENKVISGIKYTGTFSIEDDISDILDIIKRPTPFEYDILEDTIIIR